MRPLPLLAFALLLAASTAALGVADESPPAPSAERGYQHLLETPYVPWHFDQETFDALWRVWPAPLKSKAEAATPEARRGMAFERYGLTPRPGDASGKPLQYVVDDEGRYTLSCLACHSGQVGGTLVPGLGNAHFAMQTIADDVRKTKVLLRKPLNPMDLGSVLIPQGKTVGTTNAVVFSIVLLQYRDEHLNVKPPKQAPRLPHHDLDAPAWWHYSKRTHLYIDGFGKKGHRSLMSFMLVPTNGKDRVLAAEPQFRDIQAYIASLKPPRWPHAVDADRVAKGKRVFSKHCADCHGTYGEGASYPNKVVPINNVGTDRVRLDALSVENRTTYANSWFTNYDPEGVRVDPGGYVAPPLDGLWASAPYFHNGSVPTLWHVLHGNERPAQWKRSSTEYDTERVGLKIEVLREGQALPTEPSERRRWFDTSMHGKSAQGHPYPARLSSAQKRALLEYLKTL